MHRGMTLIEITVVLALIAAVAAIGVGGLRQLRDSASVRGAVMELRSAFSSARGIALARGNASVHLDSVSITVRSRGVPALERQLGATYGVYLWSSRDSMTYMASGLGFGAANLRVIVRRGSATDTVVVSRLGRVRH